MYKLEKVILWLSIESLFSSNYRLRTRYKNNETLVLDSFCSEAKKKKKFIMKNDTIQDRAIFMETECHVWQDDNIE